MRILQAACFLLQLEGRCFDPKFSKESVTASSFFLQFGAHALIKSFRKRLTTIWSSCFNEILMRETYHNQLLVAIWSLCLDKILMRETHHNQLFEAYVWIKSSWERLTTTSFLLQSEARVSIKSSWESSTASQLLLLLAKNTSAAFNQTSSFIMRTVVTNIDFFFPEPSWPELVLFFELWEISMLDFFVPPVGWYLDLLVSREIHIPFVLSSTGMLYTSQQVSIPRQ